MTDRHYELAEKVVEAFKAGLSETAREQIADSQFGQLAVMIREAISEELETAADLIEEVTRKLRAGVEKPDLGL